MVKNGDKENLNSLSPLQLFLGEYQPNITKGARIALPKKIREVIGESNNVILSRGFESCIFGYTKEDWEKESRKTLVSPISEKRSRMLKRYMFSGAFELEFDKQGRVVIPKSLLEYSKIDLGTEVVLIGAGDHFEIWNKDVWEETLEDIEEEVMD